MRNPFGNYKNFIVYKIVPSKDRPGKTDKFPVDYRDGRVKVNPHDSEIQTDFDTALSRANAFGAEFGIGFIFNASNPYWFLDIDGCLVTGQWTQLAIDICTLFAGCYIEISPSGTGLHLYGTGTVPAHKCTNKRLGLEFYHEARFGTISGNGPIGDANFDASTILPQFVADYFPPTEGGNEESWTEGPVPEYRGPYDDVELIRRALLVRKAENVFGGKVSFQDLWEKNEKILGKTWPDEKRAFDASSADSSLAMRLAFWTGNDCDRIERLMRQSGLARDKYERKDYLPRTIVRAVSLNSEIFIDRDAPASLPKPVNGIELVSIFDVKPQPIEWLWESWLPLGKLVILAGPGGVGKSTVTLSWASIISRGAEWPDGAQCAKKGKVLIWTGEDDIADTLAPRLIAMGADLKQINVIKGGRTATGELIPFDPTRDIPALRKQFVPGEISMLIIDPIISTIAGDLNKANEVRRGMQPVVDFAEELRATVVGITHFNKGSAGKNPTERVTGSQAITALSRMTLVSQKDQESGECVLARSKSNISVDTGGFKYRVEGTSIEKGRIKTTKITWLDHVEGTALEILDDVEPADEKVTSYKIKQAKEWLEIALSKEPIPLKRLVSESGFSAPTLRRAKKLLAIRVKKDGSEWLWSMPFGNSIVNNDEETEG